MADLTIKVLKGPEKTSECGGAQLIVEWSIAGGKSGFIVQHVTFDYGDEKCDGTAITTPRKIEYWEAWQVDAGKVYCGFKPTEFAAGTQGNDFFVFGDRGPSRGTNKITGKVKFLEGATLADPPWTPNSVPRAGSLPATTAKPAGWDDAGAADHELSVTWNCCGATPAVPKVTGKPTKPAPKAAVDGGGVMNNRVEHAIRTMPAWSSLSPGDTPGRRRLRARLELFKTFTLPAIRKGVQVYIDTTSRYEGYGVPEMSRIFILNRFIFNVPSSVPRKKARFFGGWAIPERPAAVNMLYPLAKAGADLRVTGAFDGYFGAPYDGLAEFDFFLEAFGPRWA
jgi:hypothetical protein